LPLDPLPLQWEQRERFEADRRSGSRDQDPFHTILAVDVRGELRIKALRQATVSVAAAHESVRATFPSGVESTYQSIGTERPFAFSFKNASSEAEVLWHIRRAFDDPFDLAGGMLARLAVVRLSTTRHVVALVVHHLICDGESLSILMTDLWRAYEMVVTGRPVILEGVECSYSEWVRRDDTDLTSSEERASSLAYWAWIKSRYGLVPHIPLRGASMPDTPTHHGRRLIRDAMTEDQDLMKLARKSRTTPFVILAAATGLTAWHLSGASSFLLATAVSRRRDRALRRTVASLVTLMLIPVDIDANETFEIYVARVSERVFESVKCSVAPFPAVIRQIAPELFASRAHTLGLWCERSIPWTPPKVSLADIRSFRLDKPRERLHTESLAVRWRGGGSSPQMVVDYPIDAYPLPLVKRFGDHLLTLINLLAIEAATAPARVSSLVAMADST
jgi:hypothetical protein